MPHEYSAENHDWDLTISAAAELFKFGAHLNSMETSGNLSKGFSCFTGSMLLSFSAIESFSASIALSLPQMEKYKDFDFEGYRQTRRFWDKIELLSHAIGFDVDKSQGLFKTINSMQIWRNLVTHASPYRIEKVEIEDTTNASKRVHRPFVFKQFARSSNFETAQKFYNSAYDYIDLIKGKTGLEPRTSVTYKVGEE